MSRVLFENSHYVACVIGANLVVQTKRRKRNIGVRLTESIAPTWIAAIETAIDTDEAHNLCKSLCREASE